MTFRELNLAVFRREPVRQVLWQPRIEHWYQTHRAQGTLPERYREMSLLEVFDDLGCSVRPYWAFNPAIRIDLPEDVQHESHDEGPRTIETMHTPVGDLVTVSQCTSLTHHTVKYPVVTPDDMRVMEWVLRHRRVWFDEDLYCRACEHIGNRAAPSIYIPRINLMRILIDFMGFEGGMTAICEYPEATERFVAVINETDGPILDVVCACPIEVVNFGDNVHQALCPPPLFERFVQPEYRHRNERLHAAGKKTYPHWDGDCGQLLPYARDCGFDGVEAITPVPPGRRDSRAGPRRPRRPHPHRWHPLYRFPARRTCRGAHGKHPQVHRVLCPQPRPRHLRRAVPRWRHRTRAPRQRYRERAQRVGGRPVAGLLWPVS